MAIPMALDYSFNFIQQAAGLANIFNTIALFPEMPKWRNVRHHRTPLSRIPEDAYAFNEKP
ncbi:hypothetical protein [Rhodoferax sp. AJA081-3]|uniref:hypothetical protein n=1 Tax=Rhodoferax sp. AJA081-3 TaxID=2752316 RepID=UPI001FD8614C|nr:hypothetical protein [Rhodoferax sp. AJA081-3]